MRNKIYIDGEPRDDVVGVSIRKKDFACWVSPPKWAPVRDEVEVCFASGEKKVYSSIAVTAPNVFEISSSDELRR